MPTTTDTPAKPPALSEVQRARAAALDAARAVLVARGALSASAPDAMDLVHVARFVLTGCDPWADLVPATTTESEPDPDPDDQLPVHTTVHRMAYEGIQGYASHHGLTFAKAAEELIYAGFHLFVATRAGYRLPDDAARAQWAAAGRYFADKAAEPFAGAQDGDLDSTDLRQLADQIEAGELTPWTDTTEED